MVYLVMASMGSFMWTCSMMMALLFICAVYYTEYVSDLMLEHPDMDMSSIQVHWGSLGTSIMSLFMAITGGADWHNLVDVFQTPQTSYSFNVIVFACYVAFATLVMLNLVTGVFVEGAQRIIREDKRSELMRLAAQVFVDAGMDSSQMINMSDFQGLIDNKILDKLLKAIGVSRSVAQNLFAIFDEDDEGVVNLLEFVDGCLKMSHPAKTVDIAAVDYNNKVNFKQTESDIRLLVEEVSAMNVALLRLSDAVFAIFDGDTDMYSNSVHSGLGPREAGNGESV